MSSKVETVNVHAAKTHLSSLLQRVMNGEEIIIARSGKPVAKLVAIDAPAGDRVAGTAKSEIRLSDDCDAPLPDDLMAAFEGGEAKR